MKLFPFQEEGVTKMLSFLHSNSGVYNASDMGTGKTAMTIETVRRLGSNIRRVLIICPKIMALVWEEEIRKWGTLNAEVHIETYGRTVNRIESLLLFKWDLLILDEVHLAKNHTAKRSKAVFKLWSQSRYKICLSGTPLTNTVMDCWTTFSRLDPASYADYWAFAHRYTNVVRTRFGTEFKGIKNHEELHKNIREKFFIRYRKDEVLLDLPEKTWQKISLPEEYLHRLTPEEEKAYAEYTEVLRLAYNSQDHGNVSVVVPTAVATCRRSQGLKKVPAVLDFSKQLLDQNTPLVIFAYHRDVIEAIRNGLHAYQIRVIHGGTPAKDRQSAVTEYQEGTVQALICQYTAGGIGITATRGSTVVLSELDWTPAVISQAVDRVHRIGQKNHVVIYYFSVASSLDEKITKIVMEKASNFSKVV